MNWRKGMQVKRQSERGRRLRASRVLLALMACGTLVAAGCGSSSSGDGGSTSGGGGATKEIAVSFPNYSKSEALQSMMAVAQAEADKQGYKLLLDDPGEDLNRQISTLRTWIGQRVPAIVAVAPNPPAFEAVAKSAMDAGTRWITYAGALQNQDATLGFDHRQGGEELGTAAARWIDDRLDGKGEVAILTFQSGAWARDRAAGMEDKLHELAPNAQVVARTDAFSSTDGVTAARTLLQAHPNLNAILCIEENACVGAYKAVAAEKGADDPSFFVGGVNGEAAALELLQRGGIYRASAALDTRKIGQAFVTLPARLIDGGRGDLIFPFTLLTQGDPKIADYVKPARG
jgi:ribose transport system substrate-binding protein